MMGLLEKADKIQSGNSVPEPQPTAPTPPDPVVVEPEPVQEPPIAAPKKRKRGRRSKTPRARRTREIKTLPDGFEAATNGQRLIRRGSDFAVSWGWCVPILIVNAWGTFFDPTYFVVLGLIMMLLNLGFMPRSTSRTVGNWISRTTYVNSKGVSPNSAYLLIKGLTFLVVLLGVLMVATSLQDLGETSGQILLGVGFVILIPPILDYLFYRFKRDNMGLWDTLFGGVWLVRTTKTAEAKGWLKRLEQLGDYSAERGWLQDSESGDNSSAEASD